MITQAAPVMRTVALSLVLATACAGCQAVEGDAGQEDAPTDAAAPPVPPIHAVLNWEVLGSGRNQARDDYQARLEACTAAGFATTPLSPGDVERLHTGRIEISIDARRSMVRQTRWTLGFDDSDQGVAGSCRFRLVEEAGQTAPEDAEGLYLHASDPADAAMFAQAGGWQELGTGSVAGQPCRRWRRTGGGHGPDEEICMWSGGAAWGFNGEPGSMTGCTVVAETAYLTAIPLEAKALQGDGCNIQVESFSVGKADASVRGGNH